MELLLGVIVGLLAVLPVVMLGREHRLPSQKYTVHHIHTVRHEIVERQTWHVVEENKLLKG